METSDKTHTNALAKEHSPYLLQHAHNPVNWLPWGEEAFAKAKEENKLVIVSIGYSACHWCHVMEHESFEDAGVATLMNSLYVCIKVDREERPDVDALYMDACTLTVRRGGWPLNAFTLPDGRPVYAGTYFPKAQWTGLLRELSGGFKKEPHKYEDYASKLMLGIADMGKSELSSLNAHEDEITKEHAKQCFSSFQSQFDYQHGGRGNAPKFPMPGGWSWLLDYHWLSNDKDALTQVQLTLDKMADGGIHDQIGGGFARYSVDGEWHIPHFEKMLYDNAQLLSLYSKAYAHTKNEKYLQVAKGIVNHLERDLMKDGLFCCALDADTEGVEGKTYIWTSEEMNNTLTTEEFNLMNVHYGLDKFSLWEEEEANVFRIEKSLDDIAKESNKSTAQIAELLESAKAKLLGVRSKRAQPGLDNKTLLSWNALTLIAFCHAASAFQADSFGLQCESHAQKLVSEMSKTFHGTDGSLYRTAPSGFKPVPAFLDDYALYIESLLTYYSLSGNESHLEEAHRLAIEVQNMFWDSDRSLYYLSAPDPTLATRKIESTDNVIPSGNSVMARNWHTLAKLFSNSDYLQRSKQMLLVNLPNTIDYAPFYSGWASLLLNFSYPSYEVALVGNDAKKLGKELLSQFIPNLTIAHSGDNNATLLLFANRYQEDKTLAYLCSWGTCQAPEENVDAIVKAIKSNLIN